MVTAVLLAFLLGQAPQGGSPTLPPGALAAPPVVDESPTAWSCTLETLLEGRECVFEVVPTPGLTPGPELAAANVRALRQATPALCAGAARPPSGTQTDPVLAAMCERTLLPFVEACGLEGQVPILDAQGRFAPQGRPCYRGIARVLQDAQLMAAMASQCCQCAARSGCAVAAGERCYTEAARHQLAPAAQACLSQRCPEACSLVAPREQGSLPVRIERDTTDQPSERGAPAP